MSERDLAALSPDFGWDAYLRGIGAPATQVLNVTEPEFFKQMGAAVKTVWMDDWKTYLRWHVVHFNTAILPAQLVNENLKFFSSILVGTKDLRTRWYRCGR